MKTLKTLPGKIWNFFGIIFILSLLWMNLFNEQQVQAGQGGPVLYEVTNNCVIITGFIATNDVLTVPETIEGMPVVGMADFESGLSNGFTSLTLPGTLTNIGARAFAYCTNLTQIQFPKNLLCIGESAFEGCAALAQLNMPYGLGFIGIQAFQGCSSLTNVVVPNTVTNMDYGAFATCASLTNITFGKHFIGNSFNLWLIYDCPNLVSVYFAGEAPVILHDPDQILYLPTVAYHISGAPGWFGHSQIFGLRTAIWEPTYKEWAWISELTDRYPNACQESDDADHDGMSNLAEMAAGTDPVDASSKLAFTYMPLDYIPRFVELGDTWVSLRFLSVGGKTYEIWSSDSVDGGWTNVATVTAGDGITGVGLNRTAGNAFYRVVLKP